jgi:hypothetical protein
VAYDIVGEASPRPARRYRALLIVTHEEIPGLLPARTTGFRLADPTVSGRARAGDLMHFWLQGAGNNSMLLRMEPW